MVSNSETGHAKNVTGFKKLSGFCVSYGGDYNPVRVELSLKWVNGKVKVSQAVLKKVKDNVTAFNTATNERANGFSDIKPFGTRIVNALLACGADAKTMDDIRGYNRKLRGIRAQKKPIQLNPDVDIPEEELKKMISVSQTSFDQQVEHITKMLTVLEAEEKYGPNEEDLTVTAITARIERLTALNDAVADRFIDLSNSFGERTEILYHPRTGLVAVAKDVKSYVLSVYGANHIRYKQVKKIPFRTLK